MNIRSQIDTTAKRSTFPIEHLTVGQWIDRAVQQYRASGWVSGPDALPPCILCAVRSLRAEAKAAGAPLTVRQARELLTKCS